MKVTIDEARAFWAHPSQVADGFTAADLPDFAEYYASGPVCLMFHRAQWPDVWSLHIGVKPEGWGHLVPHVQELLREFWAEHDPVRIIAWVHTENRAVVGLAARCGFELDGAFPGVTMLGWVI